MIVGVHGYKGAGKDTFLDRAQHLFPGLPFERFKYANKLYDSAASALGVDREWLEAHKNDENSGVAIMERGQCSSFLTVRRYLEQFGDESHRRVFGEDFWLDHCLPINGLDHTHRLIVITDVRYPNEVERVKQLGGVMVKVVDPQVVRDESHASRQDLPDRWFDAVIINDRRDGYASLDLTAGAVFGSIADMYGRLSA